MSRYDFLIETYRTERLKTLSVWSQVPGARMTFRPEPRARTPHEHMVHQCVSEDTWMRTMLGIVVSRPALPPEEIRESFLAHYAAVSGERLAQLELKPDEWFEEETAFFDVRRFQVVYRYPSIEDLIERERRAGEWPPLPGPGAKSPTERP
jgi:hypothetical protein